MSVIMRREQNVGYVEIDNPPVNAIDRVVRQGLWDAVRWAEKEFLDRVIVSGKGRAFATGEDAREFSHPSCEPHLPDVVNAIDESSVPWIAAINGVALGGGAEVAMACRMRIMAPGAQIGLPEVSLGVVPGAGGTQRLPRLVGLAKALDMISLGKPLEAHKALAVRLVDAIEDDPLEAAFLVNSEELGCVVPTWELPAPEMDGRLLDETRRRVIAKMAGQIAPLRAIDVIEAGLAQPFHDAMRSEREVFLDLKVGEQARALRHLFFAERAAQAPAGLEAAPEELDHVADVGEGLISSRILARYYEAADTVFMDGSTPWEVDEAMVEFGYAMGPYEAQDLSGLDIAYANRCRQDATRDPNRRYIPISDRMMELGKLGKKSGAGWYRYPGGGGKVDDPIVADLALEESHFAGRTRTDYSYEQIRERLVLAMINEAADILSEGIAQSARDVDLVTVFGCGFPRWRGGLMHYADTMGAQNIVLRLAELAKEDPVAWKISLLLQHCAETDTPLAFAASGH